MTYFTKEQYVAPLMMTAATLRLMMIALARASGDMASEDMAVK